MKNKFIFLLKHPLFTGSAVMVIGTNIFNVGQFAYHFFTIRLLNTADYGDLAAVISILGIIGVTQTAFGMTIIRYVASQKNKSKLSNLVKWFNYWALLVATVFSLFILIISPFIGNFLNLTQPKIIYILPPILFFLVITYVYRSILQGLLLFNTYVISLVVDVIVKIIITGLLIVLGLKLFGALIGMLTAVLAGFIITRMSLSKYLLGQRGEKPEIIPFFRQSFPFFFQGLAFISMSSTDILLVKHFFSPTDAGTYAYLSILGRIALYCSTPITQTMFPLIVNRLANRQPYHKIFYLSLLFVIGASVFVIFLFKLMPGFLISLLGKSEGQEILWWFSLFMGLLGSAMIFVQFYLSINKTKPVWFFVIAAILQPILIWFIHPSLLIVVQISILATALLNITFLVYFLYYRHD